MLLKWNSDSRETKGVIKDLDFIHCCQDVSPMTWSKFGEKNAKKHSQTVLKKLAVLPVDGMPYWKVETYLTFQSFYSTCCIFTLP